MSPYVSIGPLRFGSYGICVALAFAVSLFILRREWRSRKLPGDPYLLVTVVALAGMFGAKLWHYLERPAILLHHPLILFWPGGGFAFFGGLAAGAAALVWLARSYHIPVLRMMDTVSPAAALGYGIGRIGCLLAGDGCYGIPTRLPWGMTFPNGVVPTTQHVHPTPIYEAMVAAAIFYCLWSLRSRTLQGLVPGGQIFAAYLILSGIARFLVEFIRINPKVLYGMSNAQLASLVAVLVGFLAYAASTGSRRRRAQKAHAILRCRGPSDHGSAR
jgi:phosphatidylglycerol:prolipoprotein diacylglycerol transferase